MAYVILEEGPNTGPSSLYAVIDPGIVHMINNAVILAYINNSPGGFATVSIDLKRRANEIELR